jgi:hypothetical protein
MPFPYEIVPQSEDVGPEIPISYEGQEYLFRHDNTIMRRFTIGDGVFDHALHAPDEVSILPIFFDQPDGKKLKRLLLDEGFYMFVADELDQETIDLMARRIRMPETWLQ